MLIKFLHSISSAEGWSYPPGKPVEFHDDALAAKFIASGIAIAIEPESPEPAEPERKPKKR